MEYLKNSMIDYQFWSERQSLNGWVSSEHAFGIIVVIFFIWANKITPQFNHISACLSFKSKPIKYSILYVFNFLD